jgi:hypothetical protein
VISDCHIIWGPIVTFGDRLSPPRQSLYKIRQSCDHHDCYTVTIVGSTCSTSTEYIGELHTIWIVVTDCQFVTSPAGLSAEGLVNTSTSLYRINGRKQTNIIVKVRESIVQ